MSGTGAATYIPSQFNYCQHRGTTEENAAWRYVICSLGGNDESHGGVGDNIF
jgi:hypothetical protein